MKKLKVKIFADGADFSSIKSLNNYTYLKGFTTNPSLMRKAGIKDYKKFAIQVLKKIKKPISFEVFTDNLKDMENQAKEIASWGNNIYVKIPIMNTKKKYTYKIIKNLTDRGIKCNITAVFNFDQVKKILKYSSKDTNLIISIFAGRIADVGIDPESLIKRSVNLVRKRKKVEILWASTREIFNVIQAERCKCHIITVPNNILKKYSMIGKNLGIINLDTVKTFYLDAKKSKYKI